MDKEKTGQLIRESRIKQGLTQNQLADAIGVTNKAVSRWETGNSFPDIALLSPLSKVLDLKIEELVLGEKQETTTHDEIIEEIVKEVQNQKNTTAKKIWNILLYAGIIFFFLLLLVILFLCACFFFIDGEINIEDAKLTCIWGIFAIGLILFRFGFPLLGIGISGISLNNKKPKKRFTKILLILIMVISFIWLGHGIYAVLSNWFLYSTTH